MAAAGSVWTKRYDLWARRSGETNAESLACPPNPALVACIK